mmetsp:Transcript_17591/g.41472  ORF Transcript_17591/g.41472 Transcript_17591/m.41472 type:complete len:200 (-) Transcript_17591:92-691(-)
MAAISVPSASGRTLSRSSIRPPTLLSSCKPANTWTSAGTSTMARSTPTTIIPSSQGHIVQSAGSRSLVASPSKLSLSGGLGGLATKGTRNASPRVTSIPCSRQSTGPNAHQRQTARRFACSISPSLPATRAWRIVPGSSAPLLLTTRRPGSIQAERSASTSLPLSLGVPGPFVQSRLSWLSCCSVAERTAALATMLNWQ